MTVTWGLSGSGELMEIILFGSQVSTLINLTVMVFVNVRKMSVLFKLTELWQDVTWTDHFQTAFVREVYFTECEASLGVCFRP